MVDDILDFTGSDQQLGKPAASDLASGYLTAPVLYALQERPALAGLIEREFSEEGDLDQALDLVRGCEAIHRSRALAEAVCAGGGRVDRLVGPLRAPQCPAGPAGLRAQPALLTALALS